jgi:hypothetical protein
MLRISLPIALAAAAQAAPFERHETSDLLGFSYAWPAGAQAVPELAAHLQADMTQAHEAALDEAREDMASRRGGGGPFLRHEFSKIWRFAGQADDLVSLTASIETFTGGAHPNHLFESLLWNARAKAPVALDEVLGADAIERLTPRYCAALDDERQQRGIPIPGDDDIFPRCPKVSDIVVAPVDKDGNGRFERIEFLLAPYDAAPYVAGAFVLDVPLDADDLAAIPTPGREAFEAAGER